MVLQFKPKSGGRWRDYAGKEKLKGSVSDYVWRLLSHDKSKVLVKPTSYTRAMKRFRQIEFFKHK